MSEASEALKAAHVVPCCSGLREHVKNGPFLRLDSGTPFNLDFIAIGRVT